MKIGLLTLPLGSNYGGILQAYALFTFLKKIGHDVYYINRQENKRSRLIIPLVYIKRIFLKLVGQNKYPLNIEKYNRFVCQHTLQFMNDFLQPRTILYQSSEELLNISSYAFDAYVVGSDQVWRGCLKNLLDYYLSFTYNLKGKRIAYAVSFGVDDREYSAKKIKDCRQLVRNFQAISVREFSGIQLCQEYFGVIPIQVLDPAFLLSVTDYISLMEKSLDTSEKIVTYILDITSDKRKLIDLIEVHMNRNIYDIRVINKNKIIDEQVLLPIPTWLRAIYSAKFVITDSFHGCVFSILFNKPFIVYGNPQRGLTRIYSLLRMFHLEERLVIDTNNFSESMIDKSIDWNTVNEILCVEREKSISFLKKSL